MQTAAGWRDSAGASRRLTFVLDPVAFVEHLLFLWRGFVTPPALALCNTHWDADYSCTRLQQLVSHSYHCPCNNNILVQWLTGVQRAALLESLSFEGSPSLPLQCVMTVVMIIADRVRYEVITTVTTLCLEMGNWGWHPKSSNNCSVTLI